MTISLIKTSLNYTFSKVSSINRPLTWDLKALYALDNKAWRDTFVIFLLAFCCKKHTIKLMIFMHAKLPDLCRYTVFLWPFVLLCHTLHIVWKLCKMSHFPNWCSKMSKNQDFLHFLCFNIFFLGIGCTYLFFSWTLMNERHFSHICPMCLPGSKCWPCGV